MKTYEAGVAAERERVLSFVNAAECVLRGAAMGGMAGGDAVLREVRRLILEGDPAASTDPVTLMRGVVGGFYIATQGKGL